MPRRPQRHEERFEEAAQAQSLGDSLHQLVASARAKARAQVVFLFQLPESIAIPAPIEAAGYRICEAAIDNAIHRPGARRLTVELSLRHSRLIVRVADDGEGFDDSQPVGLHERASLKMMDACAREAGGRLDVRSAPGAGTCISAIFPLDTLRNDRLVE
jgi:signal transduction histidine kinase